MKHRIFAAIDLPEDITHPVKLLQNSLDQLGLPVEWEKLNKLHITVVFMGRLDQQDVERMKSIVRNTSSVFNPFSVQLLGYETMYYRHEPSTIYLPIGDPSGELENLQKEIARRVEEITPQPRRKYMPHVTIGKIKKIDPTRVKQVLDQLNDLEREELGTFEVNKVEVYESFISRSGASYSKLGVFNLGKRV